MAKAVALVSAVCFLALATLAHASEFKVEGDVFCDPCRVRYQNAASVKLAGAKVLLQCTSRDTKTITYTAKGRTDKNGHYVLKVVGEHENEICEVHVPTSPKVGCAIPITEDKPRIECTKNAGMEDAVRFANPIGFMPKESLLSGCEKLLLDQVNALIDS